MSRTERYGLAVDFEVDDGESAGLRDVVGHREVGDALVGRPLDAVGLALERLHVFEEARHLLTLAAGGRARAAANWLVW